MKDLSWIRTKFLRQKVDDLATFIKADMARDCGELSERLEALIDADAAKFTESTEDGMEIWFWDNDETMNHMNGFVKIKDEKIIDWMPYWQS